MQEREKKIGIPLSFYIVDFWQEKKYIIINMQFQLKRENLRGLLAHIISHEKSSVH